MSTYELLDELEAGELSVQFEGEEPQALLEWALEEFSPRIAISAASISPAAPKSSTTCGRRSARR